MSHGPTDPPPSLSPSLSVSSSRLLCSICVCTKKTQMRPSSKAKSKLTGQAALERFLVFFSPVVYFSSPASSSTIVQTYHPESYRRGECIGTWSRDLHARDRREKQGLSCSPRQPSGNDPRPHSSCKGNNKQDTSCTHATSPHILNY